MLNAFTRAQNHRYLPRGTADGPLESDCWWLDTM